MFTLKNKKNRPLVKIAIFLAGAVSVLSINSCQAIERDVCLDRGGVWDDDKKSCKTE